MRAFIALDLPTEAAGWLNQIVDAAKRSPALSELSRSKVRWVALHQAHLTLRFLGEVSEQQVQVIVDELTSGLTGRSWRLSCWFDGVGAFPSPRRARVLWAGLAGDVKQIIELGEIASGAARTAGLASEDRPFQPHLTIARIEPPAAGLSNLLDSIRVESQHWRFETLSVVQSILKPTGPEYTDLAQFDL